MLTGTSITLRAVEAADLPILALWRNEPESSAWFFEYQPISSLDQRDWFEKLRQDRSQRFWVAADSSREPVGTISLSSIDARSRFAELGRVLIGKSADRGKGYGEEMIRLAIEYSFDHLNLQRLFCQVFTENEPAVRLYRKVGFQNEGVLRRHIYSRGCFRDVSILGLLRDEYVCGDQRSQSSSSGDES